MNTVTYIERKKKGGGARALLLLVLLVSIFTQNVLPCSFDVGFFFSIMQTLITMSCHCDMFRGGLWFPPRCCDHLLSRAGLSANNHSLCLSGPQVIFVVSGYVQGRFEKHFSGFLYVAFVHVCRNLSSLGNPRISG